MGIENLKRWHWCVIGLIVGAAISSIYLSGLPHEEKDCQRGGPRMFEDAVIRGFDESTRRRVFAVHDVVIHPADEYVVPGGRVRTETVSYYLDLYKLNYKKDDPAPVEKGFQRILVLPLHYQGDKSVVTGDFQKMDPRDYLSQLQTKVEELNKKPGGRAQAFTYRFNKIEMPKVAYTIGMGGGVLVIGLIWPTLVNFLVGAGYGRGRSADDEYDLSRFKGSKSKSKSARAKTGVDQAEMDKLAKLEAELEAKLMAGAKPRVAKDAAESGEPVITALKGGPLDAPKETPKPAEAKGFGASQTDYYPTEVHAKKKD